MQTYIRPPPSAPRWTVWSGQLLFALLSTSFSFIIFFFQLASLSILFQLIWERPISRWDENGRTRRKNTWHTRKQNLACLTCCQSESRTHTRHSGAMGATLDFNVLQQICCTTNNAFSCNLREGLALYAHKMQDVLCNLLSKWVVLWCCTTENNQLPVDQFSLEHETRREKGNVAWPC